MTDDDPAMAFGGEPRRIVGREQQATKARRRDQQFADHREGPGQSAPNRRLGGEQVDDRVRDALPVVPVPKPRLTEPTRRHHMFDSHGGIVHGVVAAVDNLSLEMTAQNSMMAPALASCTMVGRSSFGVRSKLLKKLGMGIKRTRLMHACAISIND